MIPWDKIHGATTHFPIALLLFSTICDLVSVTFRKLTFAQELRSVSFYGLAVAALASFGAVISGIALTKGDLWGRGYFAWHHRFVWPAFGLLVALAVWRLVVRDAPAESIGITAKERRSLETSWSMRQPCRPKDELFSFKAVPTAMVKTRTEVRTHRAS